MVWNVWVWHHHAQEPTATGVCWGSVKVTERTCSVIASTQVSIWDERSSWTSCSFPFIHWNGWGAALVDLSHSALGFVSRMDHLDCNFILCGIWTWVGAVWRGYLVLFSTCCIYLSACCLPPVDIVTDSSWWHNKKKNRETAPFCLFSIHEGWTGPLHWMTRGQIPWKGSCNLFLSKNQSLRIAMAVSFPV